MHGREATIEEQQAKILAYELHDGQYRKQLDRDGNKIPYIAHPIHAANILKEEDAHLVEIMGAYLHDVVEDCDSDEQGRTPLQRIRLLPYGEEVGNIVICCSQQKDKSIPWQERMLSEILDIPRMPHDAFHVKLADECANLYDISLAYERLGDQAFAIFQRSGESLCACKDRMMWFHIACVEAFLQHPSTSECVVCRNIQNVCQKNVLRLHYS